MVTLHDVIAIFSIFVLDAFPPCGAAPTNYTTTPAEHVSESSKAGEGIQVAGLEFETVKSPLVYTVVVLLAGLSKIGKTIGLYFNVLKDAMNECLMTLQHEILHQLLGEEGNNALNTFY